MVKIMVFGDFDSPHEGHAKFLEQAKQLGDYLVAVISGLHVEEHLMGRLPPSDIGAKIMHLQDMDAVDQVIVGEKEMQIWELVREHHPDIVAVASDQGVLLEDLRAHLKDIDYSVQIVELNEYEINPH